MRKLVKSFKVLRRDNSIWKLFFFYLNNFLGKKKLVCLKLYGDNVTLRTSTTDFTVALSCLGGEFNTLSTCFPKNSEGLIIDAGGYIGTAAIALSKMYPNATIVTIEPSSDNFEILIKNINGHKNIYALNAALMPNTIVGGVDLMNRGTGNWGFTVIEKPQDRAASFIEKVDSISIEVLLERFNYKKIMIFKMDIEGGEYAMFGRKDDWLNKTDVLMIELHERIVPGCERAFYEANAGRYIYKESGEKYVSVGKSFFV